MKLRRRSFRTAAGWSFARAHAPRLASFGQNARWVRFAKMRRPSPSCIPFSRCQTAHLIPAAQFCVRGLQLCFTHPESRGGRSAEKRSGARRNTRGARHVASKTRVNALMTRRARRLARRLASHDAGRSPLGAPPRLPSSAHSRASGNPGAGSPLSRGRAEGGLRHASLRIRDRL